MRGEEIVHKDSISLKCYCKDLRKFDVLGGAEQTKLAIEAKEGNQKSLEKLVHSNLRFVYSVAKEYLYTGMPIEDLINEGNIGLINSVHRYDETKGFKFISYAVWWIRQSIIQAAYDNGNLVRLPVNRISAINKVIKATEALTKELNREPTVSEISEFYIDDDTGVSDLSEKEILNAFSDSNVDVSLNSTMAEDSKTEMHEALEGDGLITIEGVMNKKALINEVDGVLENLTERESQILKMYFGIGDYENMTLGEIGENIGLTNERVRQIKEFALKKLRTHKNVSKLKEFLNCEIR